MRVLRVHAPGSDGALGERVREAVSAFNGGLDIRLRFLSIGIEEEVLTVDDDAASEARVQEALVRGAEAVLLLGDGAAALAAAAAASQAQVPVVRVGAGTRRGGGADAARAIDRLAAVRLAFGAAPLAALREEGLGDEAEDVGAAADAACAERIVRALSRARRRRTC